NTAASRLREALADAASSPRFIETWPRRGCRFLSSVVAAGAFPAGKSAVSEVQTRERELTRRLRWSWSLAAVAVLAFLTVLLIHFRQTHPGLPEAPLRRFTITPPGGLVTYAYSTEVAISPNGRHIVYSSAEDRKLGILDLDRGQHRLLEGTDGAVGPFWSPDSQFIGFFADLEIRRVSVDGGTATRICDLPAGYGNGGSWSPDGEWVVFAAGNLYEVPARGGAPGPIISPDELDKVPGTQLGKLTTPRYLPAEAGQRVLAFAVRTSAGSTLMVQDLDTSRREVLGSGDSPFYSPTGHIVYRLAGATSDLWALPFSLGGLEATGKPFPISEDSNEPTVAADQTLVYTRLSSSEWRLAWFNRGGERIRDIGQPQRRIRFPALSPDEQRVAVVGWDGGSPDIWVHEAGRGIKNRLSSSVHTDFRPIWSSSGKEIIFTSGRRGRNGIYRKAADGSGEAELLYATEAQAFASDLSRDGRYILYDRDGNDIWYLERTSDDGFEAKPFLATEFREKAAQISPDSRWVAYLSDESGEFDVYVQRFPEGGLRQRVSPNGGIQLRWSRDSRKLYYVQGDTLFEVKVTPGAELTIGDPEPLVEDPVWRQRGDSAYPHYDVSADGERFVFAVSESLPAIQLGESQTLQPGHLVLAIGHPWGVAGA
ncbi:MAG: hypothetical protein GY953_52360, partial [bacterium]|nr:hypothetical protein [bacterium]